MKQKKVKSAGKLERHFKGVANHYRIRILLLIGQRPGLILEEIVDEIDGNEKTVAEHARRLRLSGLIDKKYAGRSAEHRLSPYGEKFYKFIKDFSNLS